MQKYPRLLMSVCLLLMFTVAFVGAVHAAPLIQERIPLQYGQTVTGLIDSTHFFQQYTFVGSAGDAIVITMDALSGNLDPLLLLGDADLNLLAEDDDGGDGFNARLEVVLPTDGTYVIEATRYGQGTEAGRSAGEYRLTLINVQPAGPETRRGGVFAALDFGDIERGVLTAEDSFHLFWFQVQEGDRISIRSALDSDVSASLFLYDANFNELARDPAGHEVQATVESPGIYFAVLALSDLSAGGTYALTLSGSSGSVSGDARAVPLDYGQHIEGVITDDRPVEQYTFQGQAGDQVLIQMDALDNALDPFLYLYGPNGEIVGQDDDSGEGVNAELAVVLPVEGTYTLIATRFGRENGASTGAYTLSLGQGATSEEAASPAVAEGGAALPESFVGLPRLHYSDTVGGSIAGSDYFQAYVFQARAGDEIVVTMERTTGDLDPVVLLLDSALETIAEHDDISTENRNARLEFTIPADGYYAVLATRYLGEEGHTTGDFILTLDATNVPAHTSVATGLPVTLLTSDVEVQGRLEDDAIATLYAVYASRGDDLTFILQAGGVLVEETVMVLADADLNEVAVSFDGDLRYTAQEDGMYVLIVTRQGGPFGETRGFFNLIVSGATGEPLVEDEEEVGPGSVLPYGTVATGEITDAQPQLEYTFNGHAGDRISVRMEALDATLDPLVIVTDAEGNEIVRDDDSGGNLNALIASYLLTADGEYTIIATRFGGAEGTSRGRFELTLTGVPVSQPSASDEQTGGAPGAALPLAPGQTVSGSITADAAAAFFVFDGQAGTTVQITMVATNGDLDPFLALLDSSQTLVASDDDSGGNRNAELIYTLPADGLYYIVATRFELLEGTTTGDFLLSLLLR